jgi:opacity protein-like surface antigen
MPKLRNVAFLLGDGMLKTWINIGSLACVLSLTSIGHAQAMPTAVGHGLLQVGGGYTYGTPDYGQKNIQGFLAFADFDFTSHLGVEAEGHYISAVTPDDLGENSIFVGPRFIYSRNRFSVYGKAMIGIGDVVIQVVQDNPEGGAGTYFAYAIGGGLDIRATKHIVVRAFDFEYQRWSYANGLTPTAATIGVAYRFR